MDNFIRWTRIGAKKIGRNRFATLLETNKRHARAFVRPGGEVSEVKGGGEGCR